MISKPKPGAERSRLPNWLNVLMQKMQKPVKVLPLKTVLQSGDDVVDAEFEEVDDDNKK